MEQERKIKLNKHTLVNLRVDKTHFFSKLNLKNRHSAVNLPEKARQMQKSVKDILQEMENFMNKNKDNQNNTENKNGNKNIRIYKSKANKNNNLHNMINKKTQLPSYRRSTSNNNENEVTKFIKALGSIEKNKDTISDHYESSNNLISVNNTDNLKALSLKNLKLMKNLKIKRQLTQEDKRIEKIMKRIGTADDGFMSSLLMNTDKNFDVSKFLEINMYQTLKVKKKEDPKFKINLLSNFGKINEHVRKEESEDEFSINADIDTVNKIIASEKAIFKGLVEEDNRRKEIREKKKIKKEFISSVQAVNSENKENEAETNKFNEDETKKITNFSYNSSPKLTSNKDSSSNPSKIIDINITKDSSNMRTAFNTYQKLNKNNNDVNDASNKILKVSILSNASIIVNENNRILSFSNFDSNTNGNSNTTTHQLLKLNQINTKDAKKIYLKKFQNSVLRISENIQSTKNSIKTGIRSYNSNFNKNKKSLFLKKDENSLLQLNFTTITNNKRKNSESHDLMSSTTSKLTKPEEKLFKNKVRNSSCRLIHNHKESTELVLSNRSTGFSNNSNANTNHHFKFNDIKINVSINKPKLKETSNPTFKLLKLKDPPITLNSFVLPKVKPNSVLRTIRVLKK